VSDSAAVAPPSALRLTQAAVLLCWLAAARSWWFVCDDAYISFRFARNLVEGHGLRFNPGEAPVEGFSNLLWVLLGAGVHAAGLSLPDAMPLASAAVAAALLGRVVGVLHRDLGLPLPAVGLAAVAIGAAPGFAAWSSSGLETAPQLALLWVAVEGLWLGRARAWAPVALCLLLLIRPEGFAWAGLLLGAAAIARRPLRSAWLPVLLLGGVGLFLRQAWFGAWMAQSASAKLGVSGPLLARGLRYLAAGLLGQPALLVGLVAALVLAAAPAGEARAPAHQHPERRLARPLVALALGAAAFGVLVGGDFMPFYRLLLPMAPAALLGLAALLVRLPRVPGLLLGAQLVGLAQLPLVGARLGPDPLWAALNFRRVEDGALREWDQWEAEATLPAAYRAQAAAIAALTRPGDLVVVGPLGVQGWELPDRRFRDLYGLVTPSVAARPITRLVQPGHDRRVEPFFFVDEAPAVLATVMVIGTALRPALEPYAEGLRAQGIDDRYALALVRVLPDAGSEPRFVLAIRRSADPARDWGRFEAALDAPLRVPAVRMDGG
jgi:hypothetical protein